MHSCALEEVSKSETNEKNAEQCNEQKMNKTNAEQMQQMKNKQGGAQMLSPSGKMSSVLKSGCWTTKRPATRPDQ
jgi:hypothetical protein